jgi:hypothetical protein
MRGFQEKSLRERFPQLLFVLSSLLLLIAVPAASDAEYRTLDELAQAYSEESCKECHQKIYEEWASSRHAPSVVQSVGILHEFRLIRYCRVLLGHVPTEKTRDFLTVLV